MPFRVKDLMMDVTSAAGAQTNLQWCHLNNSIINCGLICSAVPSVCHCTFHHTFCYLGCTAIPTIITCPFGTRITVTCPGTIVTDPTGPVYTPVAQQELAATKERLKQELAMAEAQEKALADSMQPQTVADADALEKQLTEALEEVRARKADLQKKQPSSASKK